MTVQKQAGAMRAALTVDGLTLDASGEEKGMLPLVPGCEVIEYDERTGQQEWTDSLFVRDFTDSVLATTPAPLEYEQDKNTTACDGMGVLLASDKSDF